MVELEDVDLAKALSVLAKRLHQVAADLMAELHEADSSERLRALAGLLEGTALQLRERAHARPPKIIEVY